MYLVLLFAATALLSSGRSANVNKHMRLLSELDNSIENNVTPKKPQSGVRRFLTITQRPLATYAHTSGQVLELTCDAVGAPAPSIHWFKNDAPVYEHDVESNEVLGSPASSLARVVSRLLVTRAGARDRYVCVARAGARSARATSLVYSADGSSGVSERSRLVPRAPRIVAAYELYVDSIGQRAVLPCRARGHPHPHVRWTDGAGRRVAGDARMQVLRSGELVISSLRWSDMGEFTCHASNVFGSQLANTFVYPAKAG